MNRSSVRELLPDLAPVGAIILLQVLAAAFFVVDAITDEFEPGAGSTEALLEAIVAVALVAGVVMGALHVLRLVREMRRHAHLVDLARGALSDLLVLRFAEWGLSSAEADVTLFALKGFSAAEIAELRGAAPATVRVQLSQVYAKAGVSSQPRLMSLFLDELMDGSPLVPSSLPVS